MADQYAIQDQNQFPALMGHSGTAGTAETRRVVVGDDGGMYVNLMDTMQELIQRLAPLGAAVAYATGGVGLRTYGLAGTVTSGSVVVTVGTVTGPLTAAQYGTTTIPGGLNFTPRVAQENLMAHFSDINNVEVS